MPYKLSATLSNHTSDVRAVVSPSDDLVLSASRDSTAISWLRQSPSSFTPASVIRAGSRFVNAVAYLPPTTRAPQGYAVVGGQDIVINIFALDSLNKEEPEFTLIGHGDNVCALSVGPDDTIISGSWDKTAKVWKNFALQYDLKGHQQSVWSVLAITAKEFLTASADKTIKYWVQHKVRRTYEGHRDAVRGLALIPHVGFASCSNDSEIRVWTIGGDIVYTLSGHTSFVYSVSVLPNGDLVSAGEDRSVRVWRDGECSQVIIHPAISVWAVSTMPNGDIVSGSSDGVVRVFSKSEERWAAVSELKAFEHQVSSQSLPSQEVGDVRKSDLPGPQALSTAGKKAGEVKMVRNGDIVEAHQWEQSTSTWQKIGEVVDAIGSGRKQLYDGKEYDYVFDVDIQEGAPPLKLPFNASENPYAAAQRFLEQNDLPMAYVDQIVQFIEKNTAGVKLGNDGYVDPFTGASRYQPATLSPSNTPASSYVDPFTGASRHIAPQDSHSTSKIIPFSNLISFKQANVSAMQAKVYQFDQALRDEMSTAALAMHPQEKVIIDEVFTYLSKTASHSSSSIRTSISRAHIETITQILDRWPASQRFPLIDLSRLVTAHCMDAFSRPGDLERFFSCLLRVSDWTSIISGGNPITKAQETNVLLLFRTITNSLQENTPANDEWIKQIFEALVQVPHLLLTKTHRLALASILFNFSCISLKGSVSTDARELHLTCILQLLRSPNDDSEVAYRTCVALGNTLYANKLHGTPINVSLPLTELKGAVCAVKMAFSDQRINDVYKEIVVLI
ncbi:WD40-repeat-containing domain protein [Scleroderma yunnanense]